MDYSKNTIKGGRKMVNKYNKWGNMVKIMSVFVIEYVHIIDKMQINIDKIYLWEQGRS